MREEQKRQITVDYTGNLRSFVAEGLQSDLWWRDPLLAFNDNEITRNDDVIL